MTAEDALADVVDITGRELEFRDPAVEFDEVTVVSATRASVVMFRDGERFLVTVEKMEEV